MSENEVVVSQETVNAINQEIQAGDEKVVTQAVQAVEEKTSKSLDELRKELDAVKEASKKVAEEQERQRIESELAAEKAKLEEAQKQRSKAIVASTPNPVVNQAPVVSQPIDIPIEQQWAQLDALAMSGGFRSASLRKN